MAASKKSIDAECMVNRRLESSWGQCSSASEEISVSGAVSELHRLINSVDAADDTAPVSWDTIIDQCRSHSKEVMTLDGRGRTCLSSACAKNPPLVVIETMLSKCPLTDALIRDKTGWTAMTLAIANSASLEVLRLLAKRPSLVTTCDHHGNTPLHLACYYKHGYCADKLVTILLQASPSLAERENSAGKTPLHVAVENRASLEVVRMLAEGKLCFVYICWLCSCRLLILRSLF